MTTVLVPVKSLSGPDGDDSLGGAAAAAAVFLTRCSRRTLDAYRHALQELDGTP